MSEKEDEPGKELQTTEGMEKESPGEVITTQDSIDNAVKKLVEKKPDKFMEFMAMGMTSMGNPLHHKMNAEHITKVLNLASDHDEREYNLQVTAQKNEANDRKSTKWLSFVSFIVVIGLAMYVLNTFQDNPTVLMPIITGLGGMAAGFVGGYGLGKGKK